MERHVFFWPVVSVSYHYIYAAKRVGLVQSGPHHLIEINVREYWRGNQKRTI